MPDGQWILRGDDRAGGAEQAVDTAAANLANVQTPGYRAEREYFRSVLLGPDAFDSQLGRTVNNYGLLGGDRLNLAQGSLSPPAILSI